MLRFLLSISWVVIFGLEAVHCRVNYDLLAWPICVEYRCMAWNTPELVMRSSMFATDDQLFHSVYIVVREFLPSTSL